MGEVEWRNFREVYKGTGILLRSRYSGATSSTRKGSSPNLQSCIPGIALHVKLSSFDPMRRTTASFSAPLTDFAQIRFLLELFPIRLDLFPKRCTSGPMTTSILQRQLPR